MASALKSSSLPLLRFLNLMRKLHLRRIHSDSAGSKVLNSPGGRTADEVKGMFEEWMIKHERVYNTPAEKAKRFQNFIDCLRRVDNHNLTGNPCYKLGLNQFSDLTRKEFETMYCNADICRPSSIKIKF